MKDKKDTHTIELISRKRGRPVINPESGPLSDKERKQRSIAGRKVVQFLIDEKSKDRLMKYCKRYKITHHQLLINMIKNLKLTKPEFLE